MTRKQNSSEDIAVNEDYIVERVVDKRISRGRVEYLIKWKGYSAEDNTWEPIQHIYCKDMISEYERRQSALRGETSSGQRSGASAPTARIPNALSIPEPEVRNAPKRGVEGFARGLEANAILGATDQTGEMQFLMTWIGSEEQDLVSAEEANVKCPQVVIKFYEKHLNWNFCYPN